MGPRFARIGLATVFPATVFLAACSSPPPTTGQVYGTAGGAVVGAVVGRVASDYAWYGLPAGLAVGAVVGHAVGTIIDPPVTGEQDAKATVEALESGKPTQWEERGARGTVTPLAEPYADLGGRSCRDLRKDSQFRGEAPRSVELTACRHGEDGMWEITGRRERVILNQDG